MAKAVYPLDWNLTPLEAAYLTKLRSGKIVSVAALTKLHKAPVPTVRVRKTLAQLRRKMDPMNVEISTHWGEGWVLDRAARARLSGLLKG
jgi:hypothetical protein